ncbi:hypothetical protein CAPTEDRAFT_215858 [Capitella teleta]|uniref:Uncharacterized protein n=1 Tax=Capitella teleta TaxID=283909 RepID=R7U4M1_CAPTE|nr:hypothetical protein CAPTEDRAFT_215858 [Capitella teleta]|eukprot:ELU01310.1 hypothetical protein CAPTEDRAFT_215858 [Capitella teleta]
MIASTSLSSTQRDWAKCFLCQKDDGTALKTPGQTPRYLANPDELAASFRSTIVNLKSLKVKRAQRKRSAAVDINEDLGVLDDSDITKTFERKSPMKTRWKLDDATTQNHCFICDKEFKDMKSMRRVSTKAEKAGELKIHESENDMPADECVDEKEFDAMIEHLLEQRGRGRPISDDLFGHESSKFPPALTKDGVIDHSTKLEILDCLCVQEKQIAPDTTCALLDGAVVVQMLRPKNSTTFGDYCTDVFLQYVLTMLKTKDWGKRIVCTILEECLVVPEGSLNLLSLAPCSHEEADTRILLHLANAVACGHISVLIRTNDSDVVVLAVRATQILKDQIPSLSVWIGFGTGNNYRYISVHEIVENLGPLRSLCLPAFHALSGCDTVSSFFGKGKRSAWQAWQACPGLTSALLELSSPVSHHFVKRVLPIIETFVTRLYGVESVDLVNAARKTLFLNKGIQFVQIPPSSDALQ